MNSSFITSRPGFHIVLPSVDCLKAAGGGGEVGGGGGRGGGWGGGLSKYFTNSI